MRASDDPTVVVELTPPGRAAVAVVAVAGPGAFTAIRHCFVPATPWRKNVPPANRIMTGRWGGECGEELVVCRRSDDEFEIHCHGGAAAAAAIEQQLVALGCIRVSWREIVSSSSGHSSRKGEPRTPRDLEPIRKPSAEGGPSQGGWCPSQFAPQTPQIWDSPRRFSDRLLVTAAARVALAEAATVRTAGVLLDQYHGALSAAVDSARTAAAASDVLLARKTIDSILEFGELGLHLSTPWRVVIAGPPNVGKSSLLNAIAGFQRAIVSSVPGTTRDIVSITTALHGWPVEFADTAGLRETCDELESTGVALADAALKHADAVIVVSDASAAVHDSTGVFSRVPAGARVLHVLNKIDLVDASDDAAARFAQHIDGTTHCASALTGIGIAELLAAVESLLVPVSPASRAAVPFTLGQIRALESARAAIERTDMAKADALLASVLGVT